jgi:hypothetical protein
MGKKLRKGTAKYLLQNSIESVLTAVEIYNKPKTQFKIQSFITLMIIGWTKALHSYLHSEGIKYFYKNKNGKFEKVDGENKSWDIKKCIKEYKKFDDDVKANLKFFIGLRNKVEHRDLTETDIETILFGECQSLLYNYETFIIEEFGEEYSVNETLAFALQFSTYNVLQQKKSQKRQLSKELIDIKHYIDKYRSALTDEVYDSQKYSIKFLIIPKISNTNRGDLSIDFVKEDTLTEEDYQTITAIIKDKIIKKEATNVGKHKPSKVCDTVNEAISDEFKISVSTHHPKICKFYKIKPLHKDDDPFNTNPKYCTYDEAHNDYVYTDEWIEFLINEFKVSPKEKYRQIKEAVNGK